MGGFSIEPIALRSRLGRHDAPRLFDVCLCEDYDNIDHLLPGASWRDPTDVGAWAGEIAPGEHVVYCVKGLKVSQFVAAELRRRGIDAMILDGGMAAWQSAGLATVRKRLGIGIRGAPASRWITRVRPKIDRIACPWLISRFIDPLAQFLFVEPEQVLAAAKLGGAIAYDVEDCEITHYGERCSFDALLDIFAIEDPILEAMRPIVRGADTGRMNLAPEAAGLLAVSLGNSVLAGADDHSALARGFMIYDALHAWRRAAASELHSWPVRKV